MNLCLLVDTYFHVYRFPKIKTWCFKYGKVFFANMKKIVKISSRFYKIVFCLA